MTTKVARGRWLTLAVLLVIGAGVFAQVPGQIPGVRYYSGQNVVPVFEGWEKNADGSFSFVFGYLNRNYEEEPEIPIGPGNGFSPGAADSATAPPRNPPGRATRRARRRPRCPRQRRDRHLQRRRDAEEPAAADAVCLARTFAPAGR